MTQEIVASYTLSEVFCLEADRAIFNLQFRRPLRWAMNLVMILLLALGVAAQFTNDIERGALLVARGMIVFAILWLSIPWLRRWNVRRQFLGSPEAGMEISFAFSEDGIRSSSPLISSSIVWALVAGVEEIPSAFLLKFTNGRRIYLPKTAFHPDDHEPFVALVSWMTTKAAKMDFGGELP